MDSDSEDGVVTRSPHFREFEISILRKIRENFEGVDLLLSFFISALNSHRAEQCLRPFPRYYMDDGRKDFDRLRTITGNIPSLQEIVSGSVLIRDSVVVFLSWLLFAAEMPDFRLANISDVFLPGNIPEHLRPHLLYRVEHGPFTKNRWTTRKYGKSTFLAYHGSHLENFYSIMKCGLRHHLNTITQTAPLFGRGIYLTSELSVSVNHAPYGMNWKNSFLGESISIIALCEVIDDASTVIYRRTTPDQRVSRQALHLNFPQQYFLVTDSDQMQIKYLLIYRNNPMPAWKQWLQKEAFFIALCLYALFLLALVLFTNYLMFT